jgi:lactate dehydrogenase-like 2-hydroxyacid dehydrogenase
MAQICSYRLEGGVLTIDNDVDLAINGGPRQRRPLDGSIGFVGLGGMGSAMAANLAAGGCRVIAHIRRPDVGRSKSTRYGLELGAQIRHLGRSASHALDNEVDSVQASALDPQARRVSAGC